MVASSSVFKLQLFPKKKPRRVEDEVLLSPINEISEKTKVGEVEEISSCDRIDRTNSMYQLGLGNLTLFLFDTHPMSLQKKLSKELVQLPANKGEDIGINFIFSASLLVILGCLIAPLAIPGLSQQNQALRKPDTVMIH